METQITTDAPDVAIRLPLESIRANPYQPESRLKGERQTEEENGADS